jgi:hypothetical protein
MSLIGRRAFLGMSAAGTAWGSAQEHAKKFEEYAAPSIRKSTEEGLEQEFNSLRDEPGGGKAPRRGRFGPRPP